MQTVLLVCQVGIDAQFCNTHYKILQQKYVYHIFTNYSQQFSEQIRLDANFEYLGSYNTVNLLGPKTKCAEAAVMYWNKE